MTLPRPRKANLEELHRTDPNGIETDSYQGTFEQSSSNSLSTAARRFQLENGRTYHGYRAGTYYFPNDPTEVERLDYQYHIIQHAMGEVLHQAPMPPTARILDIGTGTGIWAIQMGDKYPYAEIEGTDLSPIQPTAVPPNVQFIVDDADQDDWAVPVNHYDLIHTRILMGCFTDFKDIIKKSFQHIKPGGWMESQDFGMLPGCDDGTMPDNWPFLMWSRDIEEAAYDAGRPLTMAENLKKWYIECGFVDVQEKVVKLPINTWPRNPEIKALGKWWAENLSAGLQGFSLALLSRVNGWTKDEIESYLAPVRKSVKDRRVHAYHKFYTVWGRKPLEKSIPKRQPLKVKRIQSGLSKKSAKDDKYDPVATQWYHAHISRLANS